jgi:hypothetical protein
VSKFKIVRKANKVVGCVWGIGERKWRGYFKMEEEAERMQEKYLRWVLAVDRETPGKNARSLTDWEWKRERGRQNLRTKWMEGMSAGYWGNAGEKKQGEEGEREVLPEGMLVKKWKESKRKMDECRAERKRQARKKGKNQMTEEIPKSLGREMQEREKWWRDSDVGMRRENTCEMDV